MQTEGDIIKMLSAKRTLNIPRHNEEDLIDHPSIIEKEKEIGQSY